MKYFTKEWYNLMQLWGLSGIFTRIPDKKYSQEDIDQLYKEALDQAIEMEREEYDRPPELELEEILSEENFNLEDFLFFDENGEEISPQNVEEVKALIEKEYEMVCQEYENREPFDPEETISFFEEEYEIGLDNARHFYPEWMRQEVDERIIALGLLPESSYLKFQSEIEEAKEKWEQGEKAYQQAISKENIGQEVDEIFHLHDACLLSMDLQGQDYVLTLQKDRTFPGQEGRYRKIIFKDAQILQLDPGISTDKTIDAYGVWTNTTFLNYELYKSSKGYQAHMIFWSGDDMEYLTLDCRKITAEDFGEYEA